MRGLALAGLLAVAAACQAVDVGIFDNTRVYSPSYNVQTGTMNTALKANWEAHGAVWHQTGLLTPEFLATVTVFLTSFVNATWMTADEQSALVAWVKGGGTLVAIGECT